MEIREVAKGDIANVFRLLQEGGWGQRVKSEEFLSELLAASQLKFVAIRAGEVVGFARAITDGISNGYLSMVVVKPDCRKSGIGRALIAAVTNTSPGVTWVLRAGRPGAEEFFAKLGFVVSNIAMERTRMEFHNVAS
jgi:N-acetylglutamate synthase-like GNAT family acetyltransferase